MELTIVHLCPESMSLYGEYANLAVLRRRMEALGVETRIRALTVEDEPDFAGAGLIYMGAGTERMQKHVLAAAAPWGPALREAAGNGAMLFFTGNAMETLGASVKDAAGRTWPGFGLADFETEESQRREPGDVIAESAFWDAPAVGFMNKCSVTRGIREPMFPALRLGFGNEREKGPEGYASGNVLGTHLTGPVLVKNPAFLDWLTRRVFSLQGWACPEELPPLPHQQEAYEVTLRELEAR